MAEHISVEELREKFGSSKNVNAIHHRQLSSLDRLALLVTDHVGTMGFFFIIFGWTVLWLGWNTIGPKNLRIDPAPAFVFWLFISNLIQLHLMPLIMIGQNIQGKHAELRTEHEFETDKRSERAIESILLHLDNQQKLTLELLQKIEKLEKIRS